MFTVSVTGINAKFAVTAAAPEVSLTVVEAEVGTAIVAVPVVTVQLTKLYPAPGAAVMVVATPWFTDVGEVAGADSVPPVPAETVKG